MNWELTPHLTSTSSIFLCSLIMPVKQISKYSLTHFLAHAGKILWDSIQPRWRTRRRKHFQLFVGEISCRLPKYRRKKFPHFLSDSRRSRFLHEKSAVICLFVIGLLFCCPNNFVTGLYQSDFGSDWVKKSITFKKWYLQVPFKIDF